MAAALVLLATACAGPPQEPAAHGERTVVFAADPGLAQKLADEADRTAGDVAALLNLPPGRQRAEVRLFPSAFALRRYLRREWPDRAGARAACLYRGDTTIIALAKRWSEAETLRSLRHEVVHFVLDERFYDLPTWVHEGLALYFEHGPPYGQSHPQALSRFAAEARREGALEEMLAQLAPLEREQYGHAWGLTHYLLTELPDGPERMRGFLGTVFASDDAVGPFAEAFGLAPEGLRPRLVAHAERLAEKR